MPRFDSRQPVTAATLTPKGASGAARPPTSRATDTTTDTTTDTNTYNTTNTNTKTDRHRPAPGSKRGCRKRPYNGKSLFNTLSVTQINLHRANKAWSTLVSHIIGLQHPIILATEPYTLKCNKLPKVHKDLDAAYLKSSSIKPRAAILFHRSVASKCSELPQFTTQDLVAVHFKHLTEECIFVSAYMDVNKEIPPPELTKVVTHANLPWHTSHSGL